MNPRHFLLGATLGLGAAAPLKAQDVPWFNTTRVQLPGYDEQAVGLSCHFPSAPSQPKKEPESEEQSNYSQGTRLRGSDRSEARAFFGARGVGPAAHGSELAPGR